MNIMSNRSFDLAIQDICNLDWSVISQSCLIDVAWAYYYFSIQFRENLEIARELLPGDEKLRRLHNGECNTSNLSPWPNVAAVGERMDHDEFMRRLLGLTPIDPIRQSYLRYHGQSYLRTVRKFDRGTRAASVGSYEDGGLTAVFTAILTAPDWGDPLLRAFRHFLIEHIRFDNDPDNGHGTLSRHLPVGEDVAGLWEEFRKLILLCVPSLSSGTGKTLTADVTTQNSPEILVAGTALGLASNSA